MLPVLWALWVEVDWEVPPSIPAEPVDRVLTDSVLVDDPWFGCELVDTEDVSPGEEPVVVEEAMVEEVLTEGPVEVLEPVVVEEPMEVIVEKELAEEIEDALEELDEPTSTGMGRPKSPPSGSGVQAFGNAKQKTRGMRPPAMGLQTGGTQRPGKQAGGMHGPPPGGLDGMGVCTGSYEDGVGEVDEAFAEELDEGPGAIGMGRPKSPPSGSGMHNKGKATQNTRGMRPPASGVQRGGTQRPGKQVGGTQGPPPGGPVGIGVATGS